METIRLRYWRPTRWLFTLFGMGPRRAGVAVSDTELRVRAWPFRVDVPLTAVASVEPSRTPWWALFGVHTSTRGRWVISGAPGAAVGIVLAEPCEGRFSGIRVRVSRLDVGTADDAGLLAALSANRLDGGGADPLS